MLINLSTSFVYPNPTKDKLVVKLPKGLTERSRFAITDVTGSVILQQQVAGGQKLLNIDVQQLPPGRYFINISNNSEVINKSFLVIK